MNYCNYFLFQIYPYIVMTVFILGSIVRFDRDPYTWRTKSSQLFRKRQLVIGSVLFHVGVIIVLLGHLVGLFTPIALFELLGIEPAAKQIMSMVVGGGAGIIAFIGLTMLVHRRFFDVRVRVNSSKMDLLILVLLWLQLTLGLVTIFFSLQHLGGSEIVNFMSWAQHLATFRGGAAAYLVDVGLIYKIHITLGLTIILIFPFTRLVHLLSAPFGYIFRPYQIVRKRAR